MTTSENQARTDRVTAGLLVIGDEILSGRTQDANIAWLAQKLGAMGIALSEVRIVADIEADIVAALNALRTRYRYVFTTGGIGPTHDDITAESVAAAFGVPLDRHPEAVRILEERIGKEQLNEARLRMANVPRGGELVTNSVSGAPGFRMDNVFVLAGVPAIMQAMFEAVADRLEGGIPMQSRTVHCTLPEGTIAAALGEIQQRYPDVSIGSYPYFRRDRYGVNVVLRHGDPELLDHCKNEVIAMIEGLGGSVAAEARGTADTD